MKGLRSRLRPALGLALGAAVLSVGASVLSARPAAAASYPDVAGRPVPFGSAAYLGSPAGHLNSPIVGMAATTTGAGYWLVAADGGIFSYGDARYHGSTGAIHLNKAIVGMARTVTNQGYWLVASDGGIFTFGDAKYYGSTGAVALNKPIVGMAATPTGKGYWLVATDGGIFTFGDARFLGSMGGQSLTNPVAAIASTGHGGYWLLPTVPTAPAIAALNTPLSVGDTGPDVLALQQQLSALGYWLGTPDGSYGDATQQAVYALQKAAGLNPDGAVGAATDAALNQGVLPHPRSSSGYVVEINLSNDLLMFVSNGRVVHTLNTSTGGGYTYTQDGATNVANTPTGQFQIYRQVDGMVTDSLGQLWRPKFFYQGFAIHGDSYVPPYPVSHGCARVSNEAIDWIWANNLLPIGTAVWVY